MDRSEMTHDRSIVSGQRRFLRTLTWLTKAAARVAGTSPGAAVLVVPLVPLGEAGHHTWVSDRSAGSDTGENFVLSQA
jgi:hypothetical protein